MYNTAFYFSVAVLVLHVLLSTTLGRIRPSLIEAGRVVFTTYALCLALEFGWTLREMEPGESIQLSGTELMFLFVGTVCFIWVSTESLIRRFLEACSTRSLPE